MCQLANLQNLFLLFGIFFSTSLGFTTATKAANKYTVEAILQVQFPKSEVIPAVADRDVASEFEVFRNTQAGLLKSHFVLRSALVRREIANLKVVLGHEPDPVSWLHSTLEVELPKNSELIILRIKDSGDTEQLKKILDQVISSYMQEVVNLRLIREVEARDNLKKYYQEYSKEYKSRLDKYYALSRAFKAENPTEMNSELDMLKLELEVQRDFMKELGRKIEVINLNMKTRDNRVRIAQLATVVER